jgi:hypothetical protein
MGKCIASNCCLALCFAALLAGCSSSSSAGSGGGSAAQAMPPSPPPEPRTVILAEFPQTGLQREIPVDMDNMLPALVRLARLIKENCRQVPDASMEEPALLASWKLQAGPLPAQAYTRRIPGTHAEIRAESSLTSTYNAGELVAGGSRGFAWRRRFCGAMHWVEFYWQRSLVDAAADAARDLVDISIFYRVERALQRKQAGVDELEKRLRAEEDAAAERLTLQALNELLKPG